MPKTIEIEMEQDKPCKHSMRYSATDDEAPVQNVYLSRTFANPMPKRIKVTVEAE